MCLSNTLRSDNNEHIWTHLKLLCCILWHNGYISLKTKVFSGIKVLYYRDQWFTLQRFNNTSPSFWTNRLIALDLIHSCWRHERLCDTYAWNVWLIFARSVWRQQRKHSLDPGTETARKRCRHRHRWRCGGPQRQARQLWPHAEGPERLREDGAWNGASNGSENNTSNYHCRLTEA